MLSALTEIAGAVVSLLPERYRRWWPVDSSGLRLATFLSGLAEFLLCFAIFIYHYLNFFQKRIGGYADVLLNAPGTVMIKPLEFAFGSITTVEYLLDPAALLLAYFAFEGFVRLMAASVSEQVLGTLPLHAVAWTHGWMERARAEWALGPRIIDLVERGEGTEYDLRIFSCRAKPRWDHLTVVAFEEVFYEIANQRQGPPPRCFVYDLRKVRPGKLVVYPYQYRPDETLLKK